VKIGGVTGDSTRHILIVSRGEQVLILDSLRAVLNNHEAAEEPYDNASDPLVVCQMVRALENEEALRP